MKAAEQDVKCASAFGNAFGDFVVRAVLRVSLVNQALVGFGKPSQTFAERHLPCDKPW